MKIEYSLPQYDSINLSNLKPWKDWSQIWLKFMIVFSFNCSFFSHFVPLKNESFADISVTGHHDMLYPAPVVIGE